VRFLCSGRDMGVLMCRGVVMVSGAVCCCGGRAPMATARPRLQLPPHLSRATRRRHRPFSRDILSCAPVLLTIFTPQRKELYNISHTSPCHRRYPVSYARAGTALSNQLTRARRRRRRVAPQARRAPSPARTVRERRRIRRSADKVQLCLGTYTTRALTESWLTCAGPDQIQRPPRPARRCAPPLRNLPRKP
jgi:hypothetical protein